MPDLVRFGYVLRTIYVNDGQKRTQHSLDNVMYFFLAFISIIVHKNSKAYD